MSLKSQRVEIELTDSQRRNQTWCMINHPPLPHQVPGSHLHLQWEFPCRLCPPVPSRQLVIYCAPSLSQRMCCPTTSERFFFHFCRHQQADMSCSQTRSKDQSGALISPCVHTHSGVWDTFEKARTELKTDADPKCRPERGGASNFKITRALKFLGDGKGASLEAPGFKQSQATSIYLALKPSELNKPSIGLVEWRSCAV